MVSAAFVGPEAVGINAWFRSMQRGEMAWTWHTWQGGQPAASPANAKAAEKSSLDRHLAPNGEWGPIRTTWGITGGCLNGITSASGRHSSPDTIVPVRRALHQREMVSCPHEGRENPGTTTTSSSRKIPSTARRGHPSSRRSVRDNRASGIASRSCIRPGVGHDGGFGVSTALSVGTPRLCLTAIFMS